MVFSTAAESCVALPVYSAVGGVLANKTEIGCVVGGVTGGWPLLHPASQATTPMAIKRKAVLQRRTLSPFFTLRFELCQPTRSSELADAQGLVAHCPFQWQTLGYRSPDTT